MVADLLFILALGMHDNLGEHLSEHVFEQFRGEAEAGPDVTLLQNVEDIALSWIG